MSTSMELKEQQSVCGFDVEGIERLKLVALGSTSMEDLIEQYKHLN